MYFIGGGLYIGKCEPSGAIGGANKLPPNPNPDPAGGNTGPPAYPNPPPNPGPPPPNSGEGKTPVAKIPGG